VRQKTIGIIGGMGPAATVDLFQKIITLTPARSDQDHLHILIDNNTGIPDRAAYLRGEGPSPVPSMQETARRLERMGADFLVMPCNTAHVYLDEIQRAVWIPILNMMEETTQEIIRRYPDMKTIGLLATETTVNNRLYHEQMEERGLELIVPDKEHQQLVTRAIYEPEGIKAGYYEKPKKWLTQAANHLVSQGAEGIILGCTEIPLVISESDCEVPIFDATALLAKRAIRFALVEEDRQSEG